MKSGAKLVAVAVGISRIVGLLVAITPLIGLCICFQSAVPAHPQVGSDVINEARATPSPVTTPDSARINNYSGITRYLMGFAGDRSLSVATAAEQAHSGSTRYTVRLQLSSGADQSIAVIAPAGGLRPEVLDMTGDGIRNDLILSPTLLHWPITVLINDGHDHFHVAISGASPGSWGAEDLASGRRDVQNRVALRSSGFRSDCLPNLDGQFLPALELNLFAPTSQTTTSHLDRALRSGRAPPLV